MNNSANYVLQNELKPILHQPSLPKFKTGNGNTQSQELYNRSLAGLKKMLPRSFKREVAKGNIVETKANYIDFCNKYKERLEYELKIINDMDFPGYFLIKQQMVDFCKREGIMVGAGRGSAAGSLVVYSLGITAVDPIEHGLIFERFLNPERVEMPDIDTDIAGKDRGRVLKFLLEEYKEEGLGYAGAAFIMTKGTYSAKNTIQDISKASGMTPRWAKELSDIISTEPNTKIEKELENNEILKERYDTEANTRKIINYAIELEKNGGRQKSIGKHAGGIVVGNLISQSAIMMSGGVPVVQADHCDIEALGAVKFDLLGLSTLPQLELALENVVKNLKIEQLEKAGLIKNGLVYDFIDFDYNDAETFEMLQVANSSNVFQIKSPLFKGILKRVKPDCLSDIVAITAIGRPGPMQSGMTDTFIENKADPSKRELFHPLIDHLLDETYGTIVYQEQVMAIAQKLSGFTLGGADKLRKAMGKKDVDEMERQKVLFIEGAKKNNVSEELAIEIYDTIEKFAGYGFNKSHALAYSVLTYQMAYLRRHFPTEFMAAILSIDALGNKASEKLPQDIQSSKDVDLTLTPPNINLSNINYTAGKNNNILCGLSGIKGSTFNKAIASREKDGLFLNMEDYIVRCGAAKSIASLITTGAMDHLNLMVNLDFKDIDYLQNLEKEECKIAKRMMLKEEFELFQVPLSNAEKIKKYEIGSFSKTTFKSHCKDALKKFEKNKAKIMFQSLTEESELLGAFVTSHPLKIGNIKDKIKKEARYPAIKLGELDLDTVRQLDNTYSVAGCVTEFKTNLKSKQNKEFAIITVSDESSLTPLFLGVDGFEKINNELKKVNNIGLQEGTILGFDMSFYLNKATNEIRPSIDYVYSVSDDVKITLKKEDKNDVKSYLTQKQNNQNNQNKYQSKGNKY